LREYVFDPHAGNFAGISRGMQDLLDDFAIPDCGCFQFAGSVWQSETQ
jgi:hypothetical protein